MTLAAFDSASASGEPGTSHSFRERDGRAVRDRDAAKRELVDGASVNVGHVGFIEASTREEVFARASAAGALAIEVDFAARNPPPPRPMADAIDEAIERALATRGAPDIGRKPSREPIMERAARLGDQLHRARRIGANALCLAFLNIGSLVDNDGALAPDDARTLRFWTSRARDLPLTLLLDAADANVPAHAIPVPLARALGLAPSPAAKNASDANANAPDIDHAGAAASAAASVIHVANPTPTVPDAIPVVDTIAPAASPASLDRPDRRPAVAVRTGAPRVRVAAFDSVNARPAERAGDHSFVPVTTKTATSASPIVDGIAVANEDEQWRSWMLALYAARGPQALPAFERLFAEAYVPLTRAIAAGLDAPRAIQAVDEFRRNFARMYSEACPTFALTGKRPRMVMDAWEQAGKLTRLHGARGTQLLMVDGMRWDIGQEAKDIVVRTLGARASLADERILWSALPTTTPRQLATLARGMDALRSDDEGEGEAEPVRGRTAEVIRRIKVGSRDLYKLDLVEARLGHLPVHEIAQMAGDCIARYAATLPPRTLLYVFGDHGFRLGPAHTNANANATSSEPIEAADHGGTSPEEVLVPSFALVIGELH